MQLHHYVTNRCFTHPRHFSVADCNCTGQIGSVRFITTHGYWSPMVLKAAWIQGSIEVTIFGGVLVSKFGNFRRLPRLGFMTHSA
jgi:hypothetical protein